MPKYDVAFKNMNGNTERVQIESDMYDVFQGCISFYRTEKKNKENTPFISFKDWIHCMEVKDEPKKDE